MCILSIFALPRSQQDDGQRDGSRHLCSLPTRQNLKAIDWSFLRKGSENVLHFCRPPMTTTGNESATILQFSTDDDDGGQLSRQLPSTQNQKSPTFRTSAATMKPNFLLTSAETIRQVSSVSIHPDRVRE
jgi:hypothetical protein